jgi:hypothetical protein
MNQLTNDLAHRKKLLAQPNQAKKNWEEVVLPDKGQAEDVPGS